MRSDVGAGRKVRWDYTQQEHPDRTGDSSCYELARANMMSGGAAHPTRKRLLNHAFTALPMKGGCEYLVIPILDSDSVLCMFNRHLARVVV